MLASLLIVPCSLAATEAAPVSQPTLVPQEQPAAKPESPFSYTFIQASYIQSDYDGFSDDATGYSIGGSFDINPHFNVIAFYESESLDVLNSNLDLSGWGLGVGTHHPVHPKVDFFSTLQFLWRDADLSGGSDSSTGYGFNIGVRTLPHQRIELDAELIYSYVYTSETALGLTGRLYATKALSIGLGAAFGDDLTRYALGLRYNI